MIYKGSIVKGSGGGSGDAVWGSITGTLSDQTDLANALAGKQDELTAGTGIEILNNVISATISGLVNTATGTNSLTILGTATTAANATNIGATSSVTGNYSTALGYGAGVTSGATRAIQIGEGTNNTSNTLSIGFGTNNYRLLDGSTGKIPNDRLGAFTGATSQASGTVGGVPAPTTSDVGKFLSADGTWATVSSGGSDGFGSTYGSNIYVFSSTPNSNGLFATFITNSTDQTCTNVLKLPAYWCASAYEGNTTITSLDMSDLTNIGNYGMFQICKDCTNLAILDLSALESVGSSALEKAFNKCRSLTSVDLSALKYVGAKALYQAFGDCTNITGALDLSSLETISPQGLSTAFQFCEKITSVDLALLSKVGSEGLYRTFGYCTAITDIYFNSLTTNSFVNVNAMDSMMSGTGSTVTHTLHFPSNMETTIQGLTGYPLFGGDSGYVVLSYDLPATS